jgi:dienelactone hydrolase
MRILLTLLVAVASCAAALAKPPRALPEGQHPEDQRLAELRNLNSYFPFRPVSEPQAWAERRAEIKRRILVSQGLWPLPSKSDLNAVVHGRVERDDYVVDRVFFESIPGHYVTGSLYRPKGKDGPFPAILSPHGHWANGRFYDAGEAHVRNDLQSGAEQDEFGGRYPIQARAVQLARMGCLVFVYDMTGNADSIQIGHRPDQWSHLDREQDWGFFTAQAELRLQNMMGLQTWNSIRAIDFLLTLADTDPARIGVTGASGGGTQSMIIGAIDDRIAAAMPCVMVSTSMQGGCTCENAPYLRVDQGNIEIAAAIAPRPLGLTAADDWTVELKTKGYPDLRDLYSKLGHRDRLTAAFNVQFKHNYNLVNRKVMYGFFNQHFQLGYKAPISERKYEPLSRAEATVWTDDHPAPQGDAVGDAHEVALLKLASEDSDQQIAGLIPQSAEQLQQFRRVIGGAWETILGRRLDQVGNVMFQQTGQLDYGGFTLRLGLLNHRDAGEQVPFAELRDGDVPSKGVVLWLTDQGKSDLFDGDQVTAAVANLLRAGYVVMSVDLFQQGEFLDGGEPLKSQRMWYQGDGKLGWHRFSGYTYGYNHTLFARRVHDVLTLIKYAQTQATSDIHIVGIGKAAGPITVAARSQAGDAIDRAFIDTSGFRFAGLKRQDDPMFVPGAVKYLDIDGLISLSVPGKIDAVGPESSLVKRVAKAATAEAAIRWHESRDKLLAAIEQALTP